MIPGTGDLGGVHLLAGGVQELVPGEGGMEEDDQNPQQEGGGAAGVWLLLLSRGAGGVYCWLRYLGGHPPHGKGPGGIPGPGGETADRATPAM